MANKVVGATIEIGYKYEIGVPTEGMNLPPGTFPAKEYIGVIRPVAPIHARIEDDVYWTIINYTDKSPNVSVGNFDPADPIDFSAGNLAGMNAWGDSKQIKGKVKKDAKTRVYTYGIFIGKELALDPELDIES